MERAMRLELTTYSMANATRQVCKPLLSIVLRRKSLTVKVPSMRAGDGSRGRDMTLALHPLQDLHSPYRLPQVFPGGLTMTSAGTSLDVRCSAVITKEGNMGVVVSEVVIDLSNHRKRSSIWAFYDVGT
jgi:hypothetical protein